MIFHGYQPASGCLDLLGYSTRADFAARLVGDLFDKPHRNIRLVIAEFFILRRADQRVGFEIRQTNIYRYQLPGPA